MTSPGPFGGYVLALELGSRPSSAGPPPPLVDGASDTRLQGRLCFLPSVWQGRQPGRCFLRPLPPLPAELRPDSPEAEVHPSFPPADPELGLVSTAQPLPAPFSFSGRVGDRWADAQLVIFTVFPREYSVGGLFLILALSGHGLIVQTHHFSCVG